MSETSARIKFKKAAAESAQINAVETKLGQRRVNLIWEHVQAFIAVYVVAIAISTSACILIMISDKPIAEAAFLFMTNMASLIVGFYFSRTNHSNVGGIKDDNYGGR